MRLLVERFGKVHKSKRRQMRLREEEGEEMNIDGLQGRWRDILVDQHVNLDIEGLGKVRDGRDSMMTKKVATLLYRTIYAILSTVKVVHQIKCI